MGELYGDGRDTTQDGVGEAEDGRHGRFAGVPYDWRRPTWQRVKSRWWNKKDERLLTPRTFGWGYDLNLYRLTHRKKREPPVYDD